MTARPRKPTLIHLDALADAAECLRTLAHPHRLRIVQILLHQDVTVGALASACGIPSHLASMHLRIMKDRGLLACRRDGRCTYYRVAEPGLANIMSCIEDRFWDRAFANKRRAAKPRRR